VAQKASPGAGAASTALGVAAERVGDRWSLLVIEVLLDGPRRFSDLQEAVGRIAPNTLSSRLKHLEAGGVVLATPYSPRGDRFTYALTAAGVELADALRLLAQWGAANADAAAPVRHEVCGTPAHAVWYCPTCSRVLDDAEAGNLAYV